MRKYKILCIPPYEGMRDLIENISARRSDVEIIVHKGNLEEGLAIAEQNRNSDIDAIISRGCTTKMIRDNISSILTYDITPTVYDVLRIIQMANETNEKFALVGYSSITKAAKMLRSIVPYDFRICTIHSNQEYKENLNLLKSEGFTLIVGDMMSVEYANEIDLHSLLITSGIESIESAIDDTINILTNYDSMYERIDLFSELLGSVKESFVIFTAQRELYFSSAEDLPEDLLEELRLNAPITIAKGNLNIIRKRKQGVFTIHGSRLSNKGNDFCVYKIRCDQKKDLYDRYKLREVSFEQGLKDVYPLEYYLGSDENSKALMETCRKCSQMDHPVMVLGDRGTGKERFAFYIYSKSKLRQSSMIIADCGLLDDKAWKFLLENDDSPLNIPSITIYFKRMNLIPAVWQQKLIEYFQDTKILKTNRLMFSYPVINGIEPNDELYYFLNETIHCLKVMIPSLSERISEIPSLVSLYINACNIEHGTRVLGLTPDAMLLLQNHHWQRNVYQLFNTIQDLVLNSEAMYISADAVRKCFSRFGKTFENADSSQIGIDLNRSLEEIEREIVQRVYEEENMNQSKTAKRLGVSRSTIWRILK